MAKSFATIMLEEVHPSAESVEIPVPEPFFTVVSDSSISRAPLVLARPGIANGPSCVLNGDIHVVRCCLQDMVDLDETFGDAPREEREMPVTNTIASVKGL